MASVPHANRDTTWILILNYARLISSVMSHVTLVQEQNSINAQPVDPIEYSTRESVLVMRAMWPILTTHYVSLLMLTQHQPQLKSKEPLKPQPQLDHSQE